MQTLAPIKLSDSEIQRLKQWLQAPESELFVESLRARSYNLTLRAGELIKQGFINRDKRALEAEGNAAEAGLLDFVAEEMERVSKDERLMVKLVAINPLNTQPDSEPQE